MRHPLPTLIIVTGAPATGKTTIARLLADGFHLPLISKDAIKEDIYDNLEGASPSDSHRLGYVAIRLMHSWARRLLEKNVSIIIESNFRRTLSVDDLRELLAISRPVLVQCVAPEDAVVDRYVERSVRGERHPVHADASQVGELQNDLERDEYDLRSLGLPSVTVDTAASETDIHDLIIRVRAIDKSVEAC